MLPHLPTIFRSVLLAVSVTSAMSACSSSDEEAQTSQTSPGAGGTSAGGGGSGGSTAGSAGSSSGSGGTSVAGSGGSGGSTAGAGGSEPGGAGGSEPGGSGGGEPGGSGGSSAGSGGAGAGGSAAGSAGSAGATGGSGGSAGSAGGTFESFTCDKPVTGLAAQLDVASVEVLEGTDPTLPGGGGDSGGITSWISLGLDGEVCGKASDQAACLALLEQKKKETTSSQLSTQHFYWGQSREMVAVTQGDEVKIATSKEALKELLGPIDTLAKVKLWMRYQFQMGAPCKFEVRETAEGFEVWAVGTLINDCPFTHEDQLFLVKQDGSLTLLDKKNTTSGGGCAGRRPEGLTPALFRDESALGRYFARMNHLEAASVDAFRRLAEELHALGAPADLLDGCRTAAEDEVRHASAMGSLATRFGGALQEPCVAPPRPRTAEELAVENMIEGCVRETYGALVAAYQAERSADAEVRAALAEIAREEADHAGLSWRMHRWLAEQLPPESHGKLAEAQRQAIEGLRRELDGEVEDALREVAGLPDRGTALALLGELEARLWSLAH